MWKRAGHIVNLAGTLLEIESVAFLGCLFEGFCHVRGSFSQKRDALAILTHREMKIAGRIVNNTNLQPMRALLQRVSSASVSIDGGKVSSIEHGLLVLLGIESEDRMIDIDWLTGKISRMRIFSDDEGKMNQSILDTGGEILVVSQFTLHASTKKGNRPSFLKAAHPSVSEPLYESFCKVLSAEIGQEVRRGVFAADMQVALVNDGPVTIWLDSRDRE